MHALLKYAELFVPSPEILRSPLLCNLSLRLASLRDGCARLELALHNQCAEPVIEKVAFRLQQS